MHPTAPRAFALALTLALGCAPHARPANASPHGVPAIRRLDPQVAGWLPANRARIDAFFAARGRSSPAYDPAHPPVATFDWDNTMMRNDIGDITLSYLLAHDGVLQPPARDWSTTSGALTEHALASLHAACDAAGEPAQALRTSRVSSCADETLEIYAEGRTMHAAPAWTHEITLTTHESYAWLARLLEGHTPAEITAIARAAYREASRAPIDAVQTVGTHAHVNAWVRIYPAMHDLVASLQANGFDVWVVSASPQSISEVVASEVGIAADHVIGVRTALRADGRFDAHVESCGTASPDSLITFDQGKRCWINRVIFHQPPDAQLRRADGAHRQVFAAGDSDTDVAFVQDATDLKLVLNRNRVQIMCNAYANAGDRWLVQPMFIEPLPQRREAYPCSSARDAVGAPLRDEDGDPMTDQVDRVFALP